MKLIGFIVIAILMAFLAGKKGFNPWLWLLGGGLLGLIILLCLPSASKAGIDEPTRLRRTKTGNTVGTVFTVIGVIAGVIVLFR